MPPKHDTTYPRSLSIPRGIAGTAILFIAVCVVGCHRHPSESSPTPWETAIPTKGWSDEEVKADALAQAEVERRGLR